MSFTFENLKVYRLTLEWADLSETIIEKCGNKVSRHFANPLSQASLPTALNIAERNGRWHQPGIRNPNADDIRLSELNHEIEKLFGHLAPDEIDILAQAYDKSITVMIDVIRVRPRSSIVMDLHEDIEFKLVLFPATLVPLMKRGDVFLATLGYSGGKYHVIYLSPSYHSEKIIKEYESEP